MHLKSVRMLNLPLHRIAFFPAAKQRHQCQSQVDTKAKADPGNYGPVHRDALARTDRAQKLFFKTGITGSPLSL